MAENNPHNERVKISDALAYIQKRTGFEFERKTFTSWVVSGEIEIDGAKYCLQAKQVEGLWYISRASIECVINALLTVAGHE